MLRYITKGFTLGHLLTRKLLRNITSIPGLSLDFVIALFYIPDFKAYWENTPIEYADGVKAHVFQGLFGYIGEICGFIIGPPVGVAIGFAVYFVDFTLHNLVNLINAISENLVTFANWLPTSPFFSSFVLIEKPDSFLSGAVNIGSAVLGGLIAFVPTLILKTFEFFLPFLGDSLSKNLQAGVGGISALITVAVAIILFPLIHFITKFAELYEITREKVQTGVAVLYAKNNEVPVSQEGYTEWEVNAMHSKEFRSKVNDLHKTSWETILFGLKTDNTTKITEVVNQDPPPPYQQNSLFVAETPSVTQIDKLGQNLIPS